MQPLAAQRLPGDRFGAGRTHLEAAGCEHEAPLLVEELDLPEGRRAGALARTLHHMTPPAVTHWSAAEMELCQREGQASSLRCGGQTRRLETGVEQAGVEQMALSFLDQAGACQACQHLGYGLRRGRPALGDPAEGRAQFQLRHSQAGIQRGKVHRLCAKLLQSGQLPLRRQGLQRSDMPRGMGADLDLAVCLGGRKADQREGPLHSPGLLFEEELHGARLSLCQHQRAGQHEVGQRELLAKVQLCCAQRHRNLAGAGGDQLPIDAVFGQEGERLDAELPFVEGQLLLRQRGDLVDERAQRRSGSPAWAALHPVALPLEGVGGQCKLAPCVPAVEALPVDGASPHVERTQAGEQLLPLPLARAERGQKSCSLCLLATVPCSPLTTDH